MVLKGMTDMLHGRLYSFTWAGTDYLLAHKCAWNYKYMGPLRFRMAPMLLRIREAKQIHPETLQIFREDVDNCATNHGTPKKRKVNCETDQGPTQEMKRIPEDAEKRQADQGSPQMSPKDAGGPSHKVLITPSGHGPVSSGSRDHRGSAKSNRWQIVATGDRKGLPLAPGIALLESHMANREPHGSQFRTEAAAASSASGLCHPPPACFQ